VTEGAAASTKAGESTPGATAEPAVAGGLPAGPGDPGALPPGPPWGTRTLAELMPAIARSLGVDDARPGQGRGPGWELPPSRATCLFLVDGLGDVLLRDRRGHAPNLRALLDRPPPGVPATFRAGFPTTTAVSLGSLGTGRPPGSHGLVGTEVLDPDRGVLVHQLAWDPELDPLRWQPHDTVYEQLRRAGVDVAHVAPGFFDGSGLTRATLRGPRFEAAAGLTARVDLAARLLRDGVRTARSPAAGPATFVLLYWEALDKTGHVHGWRSPEWTRALEKVDAAVGRLVEQTPGGASIYVTGDHGMVDVQPAGRLDLADHGAFPGLLDGLAHLGGEPRVRYGYARPGAADDVLGAFTHHLEDTCWVVDRRRALDLGWFGPVEDRVLPRLPDVIAAARAEVALLDTAHQRPESAALIGLHGSFSDAESDVPLLWTTGTAGRSGSAGSTRG